MTTSEILPKDAAGKTLLDYPRPSVAVDTALLTVHDGGMKVLLVRGPGGSWALPGTFIHPGERLADAVLRSLKEKAGVTGRAPQQLHVFDEPSRDERGWVLSVAHVDVVPMEMLLPVVEPVETMAESVVDLVPVPELVQTQETKLPFDHGQIIAYALAHIRQQYRVQPDPGGLLQLPFTLKELREVHESVLDEKLPRDTFRRAMESGLVPTGEISDGTKGRPAALFRVHSE